MAVILRIGLILVPVALVIGGSLLIVQTAGYWLDITGKTIVESSPIVLDPSIPLSIKAYSPNVIRPDSLPVVLEVEILPTTKLTQSLPITVTAFSSCEYLRFENTPTVLLFDGTSVSPQSAQPELRSRNVLPPQDCILTIDVAAPDHFASRDFPVAIDFLSAQVISITKSIFGLVIAAAGVKGALSTIGV